MGHFAKVVDGKVTQVIVAEPDFFNTFVDSSPGEWIQTSYDTQDVEYTRKNYAGIGYTYDRNRDAFIPPQPYVSWTLNEDTCLWDAPTPLPNDNKAYIWDEPTTSWKEVE